LTMVGGFAMINISCERYGEVQIGAPFFPIQPNNEQQE
jgi:hypothetical protein